MVQIEKVRLIAGTEQPIGEGNNDAFRAQVRRDTGDTRPFGAVCKPLPEIKIAAECFAALVLRGWGIPVPDPLLVMRGDELLFGSMEMAYPNLKKRFGIDLLPDGPERDELLRICAYLIAGWDCTPAVIAADEAIDNRDRHVGQILWDGGDPVFIDHDHSLGLSYLESVNKLAYLLVKYGAHELSPNGVSQTIHARSVSRALALAGESGLDAIESACHVTSSGFADFVQGRLPKLAMLVLRRFPQKNDLLSGI